MERTAVDCEMRGFPTLLFSLALLFPLFFFVGQESQLQHKFCDSKNRAKNAAELPDIWCISSCTEGDLGRSLPIFPLKQATEKNINEAKKTEKAPKTSPFVLSFVFECYRALGVAFESITVQES